MYSSASAASSGSSSGQRSNHTQHSIVSVHGPPPPTGHFDAYRPMIGAFAPSSTIQEVSPQIYNEPTNGSNYYQSASDRNSSANGNSSNASGPNSGSGSTSTFFHPNGSNTNGRHFGHNTMRASLPHHRINFESTILGPKF